MKVKIILLVFVATSLFAQTEKQITLVRNQTQTQSFVYAGDLTDETIYFTAKKDSKISSPRLIDHLCDSISYANGVSTIYFYLLPSETSGIDYYRLTYDVMIENSSTSHTILFWGDLNLKQGVRLDSDEAPAEATPIISYNLADSTDLATVKSLLGIVDEPYTLVFNGQIGQTSTNAPFVLGTPSTNLLENLTFTRESTGWYWIDFTGSTTPDKYFMVININPEAGISYMTYGQFSANGYRLALQNFNSSFNNADWFYAFIQIYEKN